MNLQPFVELLTTAGLGIPGVDLFRNLMPDDVAAGTLLVAADPIGRDPYAPGLCRGTFQLVTRAGDVDSAEALSRSAIAVLETRLRTTLGGMEFHYILAMHEPLTYPRSEGGAIETSVNFRFVYIAT